MPPQPEKVLPQTEAAPPSPRSGFDELAREDLTAHLLEWSVHPFEPPADPSQAAEDLHERRRNPD